MENSILKNILATVAYYDQLDYPLTQFEIWKNIISFSNGQEKNAEGCSLGEVVFALENEKLKKFIENYRGFYFLNGRQEIIERRLGRNKISAAKIKRLRRVAWWLRLVPFVRGIFVTGRLAMKNAEAKSDWDVLVVLKSGKIWTGRTLVTVFLQLVGKRRHGEKIKDRVCLNHFITKGALEINDQNLFSAGEYQNAFPLFGQEVFQKFQKRNGWIKNWKPNFGKENVANKYVVRDIPLSKAIRKFGEIIFSRDWLENILRQTEKKKIENNPLTKEEGSMIIATDEQLVFLPKPQAPEIIRRFYEKILSLS